jgi:branched-chain amino acid transport system ATP-binding protein
MNQETAVQTNADGRDIALHLREVRKNFGKTSVIRNVDLAVVRGERHALIGPNGAGKSTTFGLISGGIKPSLGEILLNGSRIDGLSPQEINRRGLSRSFQVTSLFPRLTVYENLRCAALWASGVGYSAFHRVSELKRVRERAEDVLEQIGLARVHDQPAGLLAYADQRALEIGVTITCEPSVILLDEPTAGMSHAETDKAIDLIRKASDGRTLLIVEHDMSVVFGLADRISVLVYGEVIASGPPDVIRGDKRVRDAYLGEEAI